MNTDVGGLQWRRVQLAVPLVEIAGDVILVRL
jgi:hypothetical protein